VKDRCLSRSGARPRRSRFSTESDARRGCKRIQAASTRRRAAPKHCLEIAQRLSVNAKRSASVRSAGAEMCAERADDRSASPPLHLRDSRPHRNRRNPSLRGALSFPSCVVLRIAPGAISTPLRRGTTDSPDPARRLLPEDLASTSSGSGRSARAGRAIEPSEAAPSAV
jgi:hypothetical protein